MAYIYLCISLLSLASTALLQPLGEPERHQVVVVGAGVSGFAAATTFLANNVSDVIVLEASDRIGGRTHTVKFGGVDIDKGAEFVHGEKDNIVFELVSPYNFLASYDSKVVPEKSIYVDISGHNHNATRVHSILKEAYEIYTQEIGDLNGTVAEYYYPRLNETLASKKVEPDLWEAIIRLSTEGDTLLTSADNLEQLGALGQSNYVENEGDQFLKWKTGGYRILFDILSKKFPNASEELPVMEKILLGKEVQRIEHGEGSGEVVVRCADGSSYKADHVIVTVSLGVLKKHAAEMFHPPLPQNKADAIRSLGIGCVGKVFLLFPTRWWPSDINAIVPLFSNQQFEEFKNSSAHGYWTGYTSGFRSVMNHERMLCVWLSGDSCRTMEKLTEEEVTDGLLELLNNLVSKDFQISRPESILRTNWASYPYTLGAYSFNGPESNRLTRDHLTEPLKHGEKPVVMFAGEATNPHHWSTVHGALASGRREANNLLKYLSIHAQDHV